MDFGQLLNFKSEAMMQGFNESVNAQGANALEQVFNNTTMTENGDIAFKSSGNILLDILFNSDYYRDHLDELPVLGKTDETQLFARFMRDPRYGMGAKNVGRHLMLETGCTPEQVAMSGRFDDVWIMFFGTPDFYVALDFLREEIDGGNELAKKWMPRWPKCAKGKTELTCKQLEILKIVHAIAKYWGLRKSQYMKLIKATSTTEFLLSSHRDDEINFEHVPSLASIKYAHTFATKFQERYSEYLEKVRDGKAKLNVSTTTPYDIYKNKDNIDPDVFFEQLPKTFGSWVPIVDVSGSMYDNCDSIGKALSIGHYLSHTSSFAPGKMVTFSAHPMLETLTGDYKSQFEKMVDMDWGGNTDLGRVMKLFKGLQSVPEYLVILSDMQFDQGSSESKDELMSYWKTLGYNTKIIWWNFYSRAKTFPETDEYGNIFMSGYNPFLLRYLEAGFNGEEFLKALLEGYRKVIGK